MTPRPGSITAQDAGSGNIADQHECARLDRHGGLSIGGNLAVVVDTGRRGPNLALPDCGLGIHVESDSAFPGTGAVACAAWVVGVNDLGFGGPLQRTT